MVKITLLFLIIQFTHKCLAEPEDTGSSQFCTLKSGEELNDENCGSKTKEEEKKEEENEEMEKYEKIKWTTADDYKLRDILDAGDDKIGTKPREAIKIFSELLESHPNSQRARYSLAKTYQVLVWSSNSTEEKEEFCSKSVQHLKYILNDISSEVLNKHVAGSATHLYIDLAQHDCRNGHEQIVDAMQYHEEINSTLSVLTFYAIEQFICGKYDECAKTVEVGLDKFKDDFFLKLMKATLIKKRGDTKDGNKLIRSVDIEEVLENLPKDRAVEMKGRAIMDLNYLCLEMSKQGKSAEMDSMLKDSSKLHLIPSKYQRCIDYNPKLTAKPVWSVKDLKSKNRWLSKQSLVTPNLLSRELSLIQDSWKDIKVEIDPLLLNLTSESWRTDSSTLVKIGRMHQFIFYSWGKKKRTSCSLTPRICKLLKKFEGASNCKQCSQKLIVLEENTDLASHVGPTNNRLRALLPLEVPDNEESLLIITDQKVTLKQGELVAFDDSFEHSLFNPGDSRLVLLSVEFLHPDLADKQRNLNQFTEHLKHVFMLY